MKRYEEIKIKDIEDIEQGDIVFCNWEDGTCELGKAYKNGYTFFHEHFFVKIITIYGKIKIYQQDIEDDDIVLRILNHKGSSE